MSRSPDRVARLAHYLALGNPRADTRPAMARVLSAFRRDCRADGLRVAQVLGNATDLVPPGVVLRFDRRRLRRAANRRHRSGVAA